MPKADAKDGLCGMAMRLAWVRLAAPLRDRGAVGPGDGDRDDGGEEQELAGAGAADKLRNSGCGPSFYLVRSRMRLGPCDLRQPVKTSRPGLSPDRRAARSVEAADRSGPPAPAPYARWPECSGSSVNAEKPQGQRFPTRLAWIPMPRPSLDDRSESLSIYGNALLASKIPDLRPA